MTIKNRGKIKFHSDRSIINNTVVSVTRRHTSHYPTSRDVSLRSPITIHPLYYRHRTYIIKDTSPSARGARTSTERERQVGRIECVCCACFIVDATRGHGTIRGKHVHGVGMSMHYCIAVTR